MITDAQLAELIEDLRAQAERHSEVIDPAWWGQCLADADRRPAQQLAEVHAALSARADTVSRIAVAMWILRELDEMSETGGGRYAPDRLRAATATLRGIRAGLLGAPQRAERSTSGVGYVDPVVPVTRAAGEWALEVLAAYGIGPDEV